MTGTAVAAFGLACFAAGFSICNLIWVITT